MRPYGRIGVDVPAFGTSDVVTHAPYMITGLCVGEGHAPPVALASLAHAATDHARKSTLDGSGATGEACLSPTGTAGALPYGISAFRRVMLYSSECVSA